MKKSILALGLAAAVLSTPVVASTLAGGGMLTMQKEPVSVGSATINKNSPKKASGTTTSILFMFAFGDASVDTLAQNGGITKISHIEKETFTIGWFFPFFKTETYTVYGE